MNFNVAGYNGMTYGIYERINGTIYFKELLERVDIKMDQNSRMVDLLIREKDQALNAAAKVFKPIERSNTSGDRSQRDAQNKGDTTESVKSNEDAGIKEESM